MGTQKNRLNETVLLSTQKQMLKLTDKKIFTHLRSIFVSLALSYLPGSLAPAVYFLLVSCMANGGVPVALDCGCPGIIESHAPSGAPEGYPAARQNKAPARRQIWRPIAPEGACRKTAVTEGKFTP